MIPAAAQETQVNVLHSCNEFGTKIQTRFFLSLYKVDANQKPKVCFLNVSVDETSVIPVFQRKY